MTAEKNTGPIVIRTSATNQSAQISERRRLRNGMPLTNLHGEPWLAPWILPHHNPANIAQNLTNTTCDRADRKAPSFIPPAIDKLD